MIRFVLCMVLVACATKAVVVAPKADGDLKPWTEVTAGFARTDGLFPTWSRPDGSVLIELGANQLGRDLGMAQVIGRGPSIGSTVDGVPLDFGKLIQLRHVGRRVYVVQRNHQVIARPTKDAAGIGLARDVGESVLASLAVLAQDGDKVLVDASDWWVSDLSGLADMLKPVHAASADTSMALDRARSYVERVHAFPKNVEVDATLTFVPGKLPKVVLPSPANPYAVSLTIRWSIYALPETLMAPREADDRIGYFRTPVQNVSDTSITSHERVRDLASHWRLEKRDPAAAKSPPKTPITYYLDPSIPEKFRPIVREAVLAWNKAFEPLGFVDAIVVADAPPGFDYQDMRYSSIHWSTSIDLGFWAYGPMQIDPRTGEILNSDIIIAGDLFAAHAWTAAYPARGACLAQINGMQHLALARALAVTRPNVDPEALVPEILRQNVMHEVGHTLGLRHNFRGSANTPIEKLHDKAWTAVHGLSSSVMDYMPLNVAPPGATQGFFETPIMGDYDMLAIRYGYQPGADAAALAAIASETAKPGLEFATDEDNWLGEWATDPFTSGFDLGNDPLTFGARQSSLIDEVLPNAASSVIKIGESWAGGRDLVFALLGYRTFALLNVAKLIGGVDVRRVHRGDLGMPMVPIAPDIQRRALALVIERGLGDLPAKLIGPDALATMAPRRGRTLLEGTTFVPVDPPIHAAVLAQHAHVIDSLFYPARLHRILDNTVRNPAGTKPFTLAELFETVAKAMFTELETAKPAITSYRRNAQRAFTTRMLAIVREPDATTPHGGPMVDGMARPQPPGDARALARSVLRVIARKAAAGAPKAANAETSAHLVELAELITKTLDAPPIPAAPMEPSYDFILFP